MILGTLLVAVLVVWFVASTVVQVRLPRTRRLRSWDPCQLLPRWNLFSPTPIRHDLVVRYRPWHASDAPGEWRAFPYPSRRRVTDAVFSTHRRSKRMTYVQADRLVRIYRRSRRHPERVVSSAPYLHLLSCASRLAGQEPSWGLQFQVVRISAVGGRRATVPLFRSAIHAR